MSDLSFDPALVPLIGLLAGTLVGATGVGGAALATPLLVLFGVPVHVAIATDAAFAALIKVVGIASMQKRLTRSLGPVRPILAAATLGAIAGVAAFDRIAALAEGEAILKRALGVALVGAALIVGRRVIFGAKSADGVAWIPRPVAIVAAGGLGFLVGLTSIGAGSLFMPLLLASIGAPFATVVALDLTVGVVLASTIGVLHFGAGNTDVALLGLMLLGGVPGILIGARLHGVVAPRALASTTAALIAIVGLKLAL